MPSLRSSFAALVAGSLLLAGPALAARTQPASLRTGRPATTARRSATARLGAAAKAAIPAGKKGARYAGAPAVATLSILDVATAPLTAAALPIVAEPKLVYLAGVVLAPNGQPCPGACVFATTNARQMAVTDAEGNFQLQVPVQSALTVQADFLGQGSSQVALDSHMPLPVRLVLAR
jgi:hypothetical protein